MGKVAVLRVVVRLLDVVDGRADGDRPLELRPVPGKGREARGLFQSEVRFARGSLDLEVLDAADEIGGEIGALEGFEGRPLRAGARRGYLGPAAFSARRGHGRRPAARPPGVAAPPIQARP